MLNAENVMFKMLSHACGATEKDPEGYGFYILQACCRVFLVEAKLVGPGLWKIRLCEDFTYIEDAHKKITEIQQERTNDE